MRKEKVIYLVVMIIIVAALLLLAYKKIMLDIRVYESVAGELSFWEKVVFFLK